MAESCFHVNELLQVNRRFLATTRCSPSSLVVRAYNAHVCTFSIMLRVHAYNF
jgi:hypothetical protein